MSKLAVCFRVIHVYRRHTIRAAQRSFTSQSQEPTEVTAAAAATFINQYLTDEQVIQTNMSLLYVYHRCQIRKLNMNFDKEIITEMSESKQNDIIQTLCIITIRTVIACSYWVVIIQNMFIDILYTD